MVPNSIHLSNCGTVRAHEILETHLRSSWRLLLHFSFTGWNSNVCLAWKRQTSMDSCWLLIPWISERRRKLNLSEEDLVPWILCRYDWRYLQTLILHYLDQLILEYDSQSQVEVTSFSIILLKIPLWKFVQRRNLAKSVWMKKKTTISVWCATDKIMWHVRSFSALNYLAPNTLYMSCSSSLSSCKVSELLGMQL